MTYKLFKWGAFLCELLTLLMLYSATLLAPIPFGFARIGTILLCAVASYAFAYFASSHLEGPEEDKHLSFKRVVFKPPLIIWILVVVIIMLQLASGLMMVYWANKK